MKNTYTIPTKGPFKQERITQNNHCKESFMLLTGNT